MGTAKRFSSTSLALQTVLADSIMPPPCRKLSERSEVSVSRKEAVEQFLNQKCPGHNQLFLNMAENLLWFKMPFFFF